MSVDCGHSNRIFATDCSTHIHWLCIAKLEKFGTFSRPSGNKVFAYSFMNTSTPAVDSLNFCQKFQAISICLAAQPKNTWSEKLRTKLVMLISLCNCSCHLQQLRWIEKISIVCVVCLLLLLIFSLFPWKTYKIYINIDIEWKKNVLFSLACAANFFLHVFRCVPIAQANGSS